MSEKKQIEKMQRNPLLAQALQKAKSVAVNGVVRSAALNRGVRERLEKASFLTEVMRGWYLLTNPAGAGATTLWFSKYWEFIKQYLSDRFGEGDYCLSSESSLDVYAAQNIISHQLVVVTKKPSNQTIELPHDTSVMLYMDAKNFPTILNEKDGLNLIPLADAICRATPSYFQNQSLNAEICLKLIPSSADISRVLLELQSPTAAARVAGAYQRVGDKKRAEQIVQDMAAIGQSISPQDPFKKSALYLEGVERLGAPYAGRIEAMWKRMRPVVIENFPPPPTGRNSEKRSLSIMERLYNEDAYHSLSIEGYQVTEDLIHKIKEGIWNPDTERSHADQRNALAAKSYLNAFKSVTGSVIQALKGANPGEIFSSSLQTWYRELFAPLVQAQLMNPSDLAGYRNSQVYIANSRHVPPPQSAVIDAMDALERLLTTEKNAAVRAVLGHFVFVFIHPFMDGNGRIGRFLMNLMLVSGGYNWTVVRTSERTRYMASIEAASTQGNVEDFAVLIASEMAFWKSEVAKREGNTK